MATRLRTDITLTLYSSSADDSCPSGGFSVRHRVSVDVRNFCPPNFSLAPGDVLHLDYGTATATIVELNNIALVIGDAQGEYLVLHCYAGSAGSVAKLAAFQIGRNGGDSHFILSGLNGIETSAGSGTYHTPRGFILENPSGNTKTITVKFGMNSGDA